MHHRAVDITGLRVGFLTAIRYHGSNGKKSLWVVACDCGAEKLMDPSDLKKQKKRGIQASCGCQRKATISKRNTTHGMSKHPVFAVWRSMVDRCRLPTHQAWANYGGRGITVCERWQESFENFWADVGPSYVPGLTLDRVDNEDGYHPGNFRWATYAEQANNKRGVRHRVGGMTVADFAKANGLGVTTVLYRIHAGVPLEHMADKPDVSRRFTTSKTPAPGPASSSSETTGSR